MLALTLGGHIRFADVEEYLSLPGLLLTRGWPGLFLFLFLRTTGLVSLPRLPDFFLPLSDPLLSLSKDSASLS